MGGGQKERSIPAIPMKRWVQPEEIGQWILFLDGPAAASLTGDTIELDGGVRSDGKAVRLRARKEEIHRKKDTGGLERINR